MRHLNQRGALATLLVGLLPLAAACVDAPTGSESSAKDPVEEAAEQLGVAITGCSGSGYVAGTSTLTLSLDDGTNPAPAIISAPSGILTVNGNACKDGSGVSLVAGTTVKKLVINGDKTANADDKVVIDMLGSSFGTIFSSTGGVSLNLGASTVADTFMVRGSSSADKMVFASDNVTAGNFYADLNGDKTADVKIVASGTLATSVSLGAGADTFTAAAAAADITKFQSNSVVVKAYVATAAVKVYGGAGADTIQGGNGDDFLYGGDDNDTFKTAAGDDGGDTYSGDNGTDTIDYSTKTSAVTVDLEALVPKATINGTADLSLLTYGAGGTLDTLTFDVDVDGAGATTVTFAAPTTPAQVVSQINTQVGLTVAALGSANELVLFSNTAVLSTTSIAVVAGGSALTPLGLSAATLTNMADLDDGIAGEADNVQYTVENITGSAYNDVLVGNDKNNVLTGGAGNDRIGSPGNGSCGVGDGDTLTGGVGDDILYSATGNCKATLAGGAGSDTVSYGLRTAAVTVTIDGTANDGQSGSNTENVGIDIEKVYGGQGADTITGSSNADELHGGAGDDTLNGGAGDDTLVGDAGTDTLNGGAGLDTVDYSANTATQAINITVCTAALVSGCPALMLPGTDGRGATTEVVYQVEWVKGGAGDDTITAGALVDTRLDGGAGIDHLNGNSGNDTIYGDAGDDVLNGGAGDDFIDGGAGDDAIDGDSGGVNSGQGDICFTDAADVTIAAVDCEL